LKNALPSHWRFIGNPLPNRMALILKPHSRTYWRCSARLVAITFLNPSASL
jgi:hypothetical protein